MDFFRSVFSDEPRYPRETEEEEKAAGGNANPREVLEGEGESGSSSNPNRSSPIEEESASASASAGFGGWNIGSLIKTISSRSEQVIQTYRHGLDEFRVGLAEEARVVAATIPASLETGASVAQESLESVGQAIDVVFKSTADIISHGKDALLSLDNPSHAVPTPSGTSVKKLTRFEMQLHAIQNDANTYCEDPDDVDDFTKWKSGFSLQEREDEIEELCEENAAVSGFFTKVVPTTVDSDTFWTRYFYRVHKLKQVEEARAHLVKRVMAGDEEEDLSWEVDDDDESESAEPNESQKNAIKDTKGIEEVHAGSGTENVGSPKKEGTAAEEVNEKEPGSESSIKSKDFEGPSGSSVNENANLGGETPEDKSDQSVPVKEIEEDKTSLEAKTDNGESCKDSDFSVVSSQVSAQEEDDIGWDEIEDMGSNDETKATTSRGSPNKVDIHKRLGTADDDEDLSWDIEDDDDVKS